MSLNLKSKSKSSPLETLSCQYIHFYSYQILKIIILLEFQVIKCTLS